MTTFAYGTKVDDPMGMVTDYDQIGGLDSETGDYYYRASYYDPKVGRFLSEDPIRFAGGDVNLYRYVENNPILYIDPMGRDKVKAAFLAAIIALAIYHWGIDWIIQQAIPAEPDPKPKPSCNPLLQSCPSSPQQCMAY